MPRQLVKIAMIKDGLFKEFNPTAELPNGWGVFRYFYKDVETGEPIASTQEDIYLEELHAIKQNIPRIIKGYLEEFEGQIIDHTAYLSLTKLLFDWLPEKFEEIKNDP